MLSGKNCTKVVCALLAVAALTFCTSYAGATVITPLNGSFEDPALTENPSGYTLGFSVPTSWSASPNAGMQLVHRPTAGFMLYPLATDGHQMYGLESNGEANNATRTGIQQDLGTMTTGETYTFNALLYSNSAGTGSRYRVSFWDVTAATELAAITQANFDPSAGGTVAFATLPATFSYTATSARNGDALRLIMEAEYNVGSRMAIDAVTVTTSTIPAPGTLALLVTGLFGLLCYAWRKRR